MRQVDSNALWSGEDLSSAYSGGQRSDPPLTKQIPLGGGTRVPKDDWHFFLALYGPLGWLVSMNTKAFTGRKKECSGDKRLFISLDRINYYGQCN